MNLSTLKKGLTYLSENIYKHVEKNSGNMLLILSITGMLISSLAQAGAILFNKKYTNSQKAFMVPQELVEGIFNMISIFAIAKPTQKLAETCVKRGKILSKNLSNYMKANNINQKKSIKNFDLGKSIDKVIENIQKSDEFIHSSKSAQDSMLLEHFNALEEYNSIADATSAYATTGAMIMSATVFTPLIRNTIASKAQNINLKLISEVDERCKRNTTNKYQTTNTFKSYPLFHY